MLGMKTDYFTGKTTFTEEIKKLQADCSDEELEAYESSINAPMFMTYKDYHKQLHSNQFSAWHWVRSDSLELLRIDLAGKHFKLFTRNHETMASFTSIYKVRTMMLTKAEHARMDNDSEAEKIKLKK